MIFKEQNLVFKSEDKYTIDFETHMLARKMLQYPEKVNLFLISQFSKKQFGLSNEERNELSLFHSNGLNNLMYFCKKDKYEASLKNLKLRIIENTFNFMYDWKQLNFMSCKEM
jgi:hypothetical protein